MSEIQAVIFDKKKWTPAAASKWLKHAKIAPLKAVHATKSFLRYRIKPPSEFKRFAIKTASGGVKFVIGFHR